MARSGGYIKKRTVEADPVYGNKLLAKFINQLMVSGKKSVAQAIVYKALDVIKNKGSDPVKVLEQAVTAVGPRVEVKPRRVGGASYQVPMEVRGDRRVSLAVRWIIAATKKRPSKDFHTFADKLAAELLDTLQNQGEAVRKRDTVHRMAEANRAFAHFRW